MRLSNVLMMSFMLSFIKIRYQQMGRQVCLTMPSCVLLWHYDCLRQVTIKIVLVGLLVTIFQVLCVKFSIK